MKAFIKKITLFAALLMAIDFLLGESFSHMVANARGGDNGRNNYICDKVDADILIFGSSRAIHHYNPRIISDSLDMSCYNCGQDGNGSILNYGRFQMILKRYHPKVVIYDVMPKYDLLEGEDNHRFLGWLRAYYDRPGIAEIFEDVDSIEKYKMMSQMYRYNTKFIQIVSDYFHPVMGNSINGFRPLNKKMDVMKISKEKRLPSINYDSLKITYLEMFFELAEKSKCKLVVVVSPIWRGMDKTELKPVERYCSEKGYLFLDYSNNPYYLHNNELSCDGGHLNAQGADEFTKDLVKDLRSKLFDNIEECF